MAKNIVVLSDGTGQEGGRGHDTNVYKLMRMLEDRTERQIVFYDQGIGTDQHAVTGSVAGAGFSENILQCYQFIYDNYNADDKLFLLGFSRGAATVRSLASFIHFFGILPKSRPELIKQAYDIYKIGHLNDDDGDMTHTIYGMGDLNLKTQAENILRRKPLNEQANEFVHAHPNQWASIEFLGVWDTVPALGLPAAVINKLVNYMPGWKHRFHDFTLHPSVRNAYHALSIDDDRAWFLPTIWDSCSDPRQKVEQVWFSGSHTDVGGGFDEAGLSDITLEWMVQKAVAHGIRLYMRSIRYWNFCVAPDATDDIHPPRAGSGRVYPYAERSWPVEAEKTFGTPTIHQSVLDRAAQLDDYKPWILEKFPEHKIEPWVTHFDYDSIEMSIRDYDQHSSHEKFKFDGDQVKTLSLESDANALLDRGRWRNNRLRRDLARWRKR
jgi:hypothetical protein